MSLLSVLPWRERFRDFDLLLDYKNKGITTFLTSSQVEYQSKTYKKRELLQIEDGEIEHHYETNLIHNWLRTSCWSCNVIIPRVPYRADDSRIIFNEAIKKWGRHAMEHTGPREDRRRPLKSPVIRVRCVPHPVIAAQHALTTLQGKEDHSGYDKPDLQMFSVNSY